MFLAFRAKARASPQAMSKSADGHVVEDVGRRATQQGVLGCSDSVSILVVAGEVCCGLF